MTIASQALTLVSLATIIYYSSRHLASKARGIIILIRELNSELPALKTDAERALWTRKVGTKLINHSLALSVILTLITSAIFAPSIFKIVAPAYQSIWLACATVVSILGLRAR